MRNVHPSLSSFLFGFSTKTYLSLDKAPNFNIYLGTHPSNTGLKLVYYCLYYLEVSFATDIFPHPFNIIFIVFVQI